jgi:glycosyltransferase involved in cell wall biosynthesis
MKSNVLILTNEINRKSGWGNCSYQWVSGLAENYNLFIFTDSNANNQFNKLNIKPDKILFSKSDKFKALTIIIDLIRIIITIKIKRINIIHSFIEPYAPLAYYLAKIYRAKLFIQIHGSYAVIPSKNKTKKLYQNAFNKSNHIFSNSAYTAKRFISAFDYTKGNIKIIHLGVNLEEYSMNKKNETKGKYFIFVGQSKPRKGLQELVNAFILFQKVKPDFSLVVVGDFGKSRPYNKKIIEIIKNNNLNVEFKENISHQELILLYQKAYANILLSKSLKCEFEGFGLVHLEANACGTLTIGSEKSANAEIIINGETGFLVPQSDLKKIVFALHKVIESVEQKDVNYIDKCISHANSFTWAENINKMMESYKS